MLVYVYNVYCINSTPATPFYYRSCTYYTIYNIYLQSTAYAADPQSISFHFLTLMDRFCMLLLSSKYHLHNLKICFFLNHETSYYFKIIFGTLYVFKLSKLHCYHQKMSISQFFR